MHEGFQYSVCFTNNNNNNSNYNNNKVIIKRELAKDAFLYFPNNYPPKYFLIFIHIGFFKFIAGTDLLLFKIKIYNVFFFLLFHFHHRFSCFSKDYQLL
jgi:hypothetical protein